MEKIKKIESKILKELCKPRPDWSRKGDFGRLLVIGGSRRYTGAPALCSLAALRAGCDLVRTACPESISSVIASFSPNLIAEPLEGDFLNPADLDFLIRLSQNFDAVCIGSGLGRMSATIKTVAVFLEELEKPCVIDADAIHALACVPFKFPRKRKVIITPHAHEFYSLTGLKPRQDKSRIALTAKCSRGLGATVLLKGYRDIISDGRNTAVNTTGSPNMTVGGTGDVVSGICGALLARSMTPYKAACAAAFIAGSAGDLASEEKGPGLLATDVIEKIPAVLWKR